MAVSKNTSVSTPSQQKSLTPAQMRALAQNPDFAIISKWSEATGTDLGKMLNEALKNYTHVVLVSRAQVGLEKIKRSEKVQRKAKLKMEIDACLSALEKDLTPA